MAYRPRIVDSIVLSTLNALGAVVIEGPKASGKTATGMHHACSSLRLDTDFGARAMVAIDPQIVLEGPIPRLIDEWQVEPDLWNHIRHAIDDRGRPGQFILTGSSMPTDDITRHSGAGRIGRIRMRPMSLFESDHSNAAVSLAALLSGVAPQPATSPLTVADLADRVSTGGWPGLQGLSVQRAQDAIDSYVDETVRTDVSRLDASRRDPTRVRRLITSIARNTGTQAAAKRLAGDAGGTDGPLHADTAREYLDALSRLMILEDLPAWSPHLRSRTRLRTSPTRHFVDPSIAVSALGGSPSKLLADGETFGFMFESLAVRDLRIYSQLLGGEVSHYRDESDLEVDAIVTLRDGRWAAFEVKLGESQADTAAENLIKFCGKINTELVGEPAALVVLTGGRYAYTRPDGVSVVPLATLGP